MRTRALLLLLLAASLSGSLQAGFVYAFEGLNGYRFEFERPVLYRNGDSELVFGANMNYCENLPESCFAVAVRGNGFNESLGAYDYLNFSPLHANFQDRAFSQTGTFTTLANSPVDGRLLIYALESDFLFEYFFKDSTGERTFRYYTDRLIARDRNIGTAGLAECTAFDGRSCEGVDFNVDINDFEQSFDGLAFSDSVGPFAYLFPRFALSTLGTHYTDAFAPNAGVLTIRRVRNPFNNAGPGGDPGTDPAPVPEPGSLLLSAAGLCGLLWVRQHRENGRRRREPKNS